MADDLTPVEQGSNGCLGSAGLLWPATKSMVYCGLSDRLTIRGLEWPTLELSLLFRPPEKPDIEVFLNRIFWDQEEPKGAGSFEIIKKCFSTSGEVRGLEWPSVGDLTPLPASRGTRHFSEHKKLLFVSPQNLLRSGGGQGDKICWDQKLREMEKQRMQRNLPQCFKDNDNGDMIYLQYNKIV